MRARNEDVRAPLSWGGQVRWGIACVLVSVILAGCGLREINHAPVARAGPAQNVTAGATVTLDASASTDADGDALTYTWSFTSVPTGSTAALSSASAVRPTFTADLAGSYVLRLVVNDGTVNSHAATVTVTAAVGNSAPVASPGPAQNVTVGQLVTLDGTASSDADHDPLTYAWSLTSTPGGSSAALSDASTAHPSFTPDLAGSYVVQLVVSDGSVDSDPATVTITAAAANSRPVATAGAAQNVPTGAVVTLDGTASRDADGDPLTYSWSFTSVPASSTATLSDATAVQPTFTADLAGDYVLQLIVSDGSLSSDPATVTVTAATTTTFLPTYTFFASYLVGATDTAVNGSNDFKATTGSPVTAPPIKFWNGTSGKLELFKSSATVWAINFDGNSVSSGGPFADGGTVGDMSPTTGTGIGLQRYVSMPYTATSGPVTVKAYYTWSSTSAAYCVNAQILLVNASGTILKAQSACDATGSTQSSVETSFADPDNTEVLVLFTRNGDVNGSGAATGGLRIWGLELTK